MGLPDLGVGLVCLPGLETIAQSLAASIDVVEIEPQTLWTHAPGAGRRGFRVDPARFAPALALGRPIVAHSIGCPVGGSRPPDPAQLAALKETFAVLKPHWWSDHMSFLAAPEGGEWRNLGFLMPPCQSAAAIPAIVERIKGLQDAFGLPFCFETGVNYLRPREGELADGDFWGEVADRADCGILLDVHNVWANGRNGRQGIAAVAGRLPLERVWEIHVADGQWHEGYWLDSHSGLPCDELLDQLAALVPRLPALHAILIEMIPDHVEARDIGDPPIAESLGRLRAIWETRGSQASVDAPRPPPVTAPAGPALRERESELRAALASEGGEPALDVYRDLIAMARRGTLVDALPLAMRYLRRALGPDGLDALLKLFWAEAPPEAFMSDEASRFARFAASRRMLPHLDEVLAFELAAHRAAITGEAQLVCFTCLPEPLLLALKQGDPIDPQPCPPMEVEVTPPKRVEARPAARSAPLLRSRPTALPTSAIMDRASAMPGGRRSPSW